MEFLKTLWEGIYNTSLLEWIAFATGLLYVILAAKRLIICWLFAFVSSVIFVYLCFIGALYLESILQLFYVAMAIVGWISWRQGQDEVKEIKQWTISQHVTNIAISGFVAAVAGLMFDLYTNQASPYIDAFTTVFSLAATFMVTRKVMENWLYWIVIDLFSVYLYASRGYYALALQMAIFTVLALVAYMAWRKQFKLQSA